MDGLQRVGEYELLARLGNGGMAQIFAARLADQPNAPIVALKRLAAPDDADAKARFADEARVLAVLSHPHIAKVLHVDVEGPMPYMVMELIDGLDLSTLMQRCTSIAVLPSYAASLTIVAHAALGLDHAHRRTDNSGKPLRLVHRDISLGNIMITRMGDVKVVDFGIARSRLSTFFTAPGLLVGKPSYMAPEQCLQRHVTHRADIFALGVVLYELTTGTRCFRAASDLDTMTAIVMGDFARPTTICAGYPPSLEHVICTALAPEPTDRYDSCAQLVYALEDVMAEQRWMGGSEAIAQMIGTAFSMPTPRPSPAQTLLGIGVPFDQQLTRGNLRSTH